LPNPKHVPKEYNGPYKFYNDTVTLWFDPKFHTYYREFGEELVSVDGVTTVIHIIDKSKFLIPWAAKQVGQKIIATMPRDVLRQTTVPILWLEFEKLVETAQKKPREIFGEAGDIGKEAHKYIEIAIKDAIENNFGTVSKPEHFPSEEKALNCFIAAINWMHKHSVQWISSERLVFHKKLDYAGTMDGLAKVSSCNDKSCCQTPFSNVMSVIDWKSSNGLWPDYVIQTAAYQRAYEEETKVEVTDRFILRLGKEDGKFEPWHLSSAFTKYDFKVFVDCLELYRSFDHLKIRMDKYKRGVYAKKKEKK